MRAFINVGEHKPRNASEQRRFLLIVVFVIAGVSLLACAFVRTLWIAFRLI